MISFLNIHKNYFYTSNNIIKYNFEIFIYIVYVYNQQKYLGMLVLCLTDYGKLVHSKNNSCIHHWCKESYSYLSSSSSSNGISTL